MLVKYIPNILSQEGREVKEIPQCDYVEEALMISGLDYYNKKIIVNGRVCDDWNDKLKKDEEIIICSIVEDPATIGAVIANFIVAAFTEYLAITIAVLSAAYGIYSALTQPKLPNFGSIGEGLDEQSPTYRWDGIKTTQEVGTPIPVVYGEHPVGGNIINFYTTNDGKNNIIHVLLALCEGEIESISDVQINENPYTNYEGVSLETRFGTKDQTVIPNFSDLHNVYTLSGVNLNEQNDSHTYQTINDDVEAFEVNLDFGGGIFQVNAKGNFLSWSVSVKVEYKLTSSGIWIDNGTQSFSERSRSGISRKIIVTGLTAGKYDIRVTRTSSASTVSPTRNGDMTFKSVDEIQTDDIRYPMIALLGIRAIATDQLSGSTPNFRATLKARKVRIPKVMNGGNEVDWEDYYWNPTAVEFRLLSDDTSLTWDGSTYVDRYSANPIWCMRDILMNNLFGIGDYINTENINDARLLEEAKYAEEKVLDGNGVYEKRFRMDVVIDSLSKALDILGQMASSFRGIIFYSQGAVQIKIDRPIDRVQMFGMGNIIKNSFSQQWESLQKRYNRIQIQFMDKGKDYKFNTIVVEDEDSINAGDPINVKSIRYFGTRISYALREGRYALKVSKYISRGIRFKAGIDAIAIQPGDRFGISHDLPQIGFSGNVVSGTSTTITLDRQVTIESGKTYDIIVRHDDDTIETKTVTNSPETTDTLSISGSFTKTPVDFEKYAFGEENIAVKDFRAINMRRMGTHQVEIMGVEYNENVYDDTDVTIPQDNFSVLSTTLQDVGNLDVSELLIEGNDGTLINTIRIFFNKPNQDSHYLNTYQKSKIFLSDYSGVTWLEIGETTGNYYVINDDIATGQTYTIAVVSVNTDSQINSISSSPQQTITILGKQAKPSQVTNFSVSQRGDKIVFSFDPIPDGDLARYIIKKGSEWSIGDIIAERIDATTFETPVGSIGEETYMIKAIDTSENESSAASIDSITVSPPPEMNFVQQVDPWTRNREYKLTNIDTIQDNRFNVKYTRDVFVLKTTDTFPDEEGNAWDGLDMGAKGFETSGNIEQTIPIDLETIFEFNIIVDLDSDNVSGGSITVQISTSEDNITYTSFANIDPTTNYRARYVKFKYVFVSDGTNQVYFYGGTIFINAGQVIVDFGRDVDINAGGTVVTFRTDFTSTPRITGLSIKNGVLGVIEVTTISSTGMTVKVRNLGDTAYIGTAEIDWEVKGT